MSDSGDIVVGRITLADRQKVYDFAESRLEAFAQATARAEEMLRAETAGSVLSGLDAIEVTIIDDPSIARVHAEFFDDPSVTDVITFDHGEILVSAETAERQAGKFGTDFEQELVLYMIHGLAHLAGYDDREEAARAEMTARQEALLAEVWQG